jgi:putative tricarboxylic transport membrane protein
MFEIGILHIAVALMGVVVGIVFGAIPGMTATMALAIFLPLTYAYDLHVSLYLLLGLYVGGISGGLIPAILINIPGTPSSITTTFDGYPMARRGEGERALRIGITSSLFGGLFSLAVLWFFTPPLARMAINMSRGIFAGFLGVMTALVGTFNDNNMIRLVPEFLRVELIYGFSLLPVLIGLFAISQVFEEAEACMLTNRVSGGLLDKKVKKFSFKDLKGNFINIVRSSAIGTFMGILPGVGGSAASILAYAQTKNFSKKPEELGKGAVEGLVSSESANNGLTGGALVPLLSLGIPGDSTTAILIGAFMLQGIQVGPLFITQNPDIWNTILLALLVCNFLMFFAMFFPIKLISKIIMVPNCRLYPIIILMCVVGAYAINSGVMFDVWTLLLFGIVGYLFGKIRLPIPPYLIGFILGRDLEKYFIDALKGSNGYLSVFFSRPIGNVVWVLIALSIIYAIYDNRKTAKTA